MGPIYIIQYISHKCLQELKLYIGMHDDNYSCKVVYNKEDAIVFNSLEEAQAFIKSKKMRKYWRVITLD